MLRRVQPDWGPRLPKAQPDNVSDVNMKLMMVQHGGYTFPIMKNSAPLLKHAKLVYDMKIGATQQATTGACAGQQPKAPAEQPKAPAPPKQPKATASKPPQKKQKKG